MGRFLTSTPWGTSEYGLLRTPGGGRTSSLFLSADESVDMAARIGSADEVLEALDVGGGTSSADDVLDRTAWISSLVGKTLGASAVVSVS